MTDFKYADVYEAIAACQPERPAVLQGERGVSWGDFDVHADAIAANLIEAGLARHSKVPAYL